MNIYHDSHQLQYRTPFGALPAGGSVRLSLDVTAAAPPVFCQLVLYRDGETPEVCDMTRDTGSPSRFSATVTASSQRELIWYYFIVRDQSGSDVYYGNNDEGLGGMGRPSDTKPVPYQITVYEPLHVPEWFKNAIVYQIFPDRFNRGERWTRQAVPRHPADWKGAAHVLQEDWNDTPFYSKNSRGEVTRWPFFGGTLEGIREKLLYLKSLGVSALYLNPIFKAASNHKYDTADYYAIDPGFGDEADFLTLVQSARELGIHLILDGVFSHTGADSLYFNRYGNYAEPGAYQGPSSPFYNWYDFTSFPDQYDCWWGVRDLPKVDKSNASYRAFIYDRPDAVIRHWLELGADGWRLDVADELPDDFIRGIRRAMDETKPDAVLMGEVWEDASNKISYGVRRDYLLGGSLQSVMNYPFRAAALDYMRGELSAHALSAQLMSLYENYPPDAFDAALNLVGSHDRVRVLTVLGDAPENLDQTEKEYYKLPPDKYGLAKARLKILSLMQFTAAGVPCIYYGDEAGVQGYEDPYNRATFPWGREDMELLSHYQLLALLRRQFTALRHGTLKPSAMTDHVFTLSRQTEDESLLLLVNRGIFEHEAITRRLEGQYVLDLLTSQELTLEDDTLALTLPPLTARLLCVKKAPPITQALPRASGILCALSSVPASGLERQLTFEDVCRFIDFLSDSGQKLWQLLPLNPAGKGDSPFYSPSLFALGASWAEDDTHIDSGDYDAFCRDNAYWLDDDALYWVLKGKNNDLPWQCWPEDERTVHDRSRLLDIYRAETDIYRQSQYRRHRFWVSVRNYAHQRGITLIGDLPIYAAPDSADVWTHQALFRLDTAGNPALHAGVPPDYFTPDGQDWGNPLYNWEADQNGIYLFWEMRLRRALDLYDTVRLDHFRSFSAYFAVHDGRSPAEGQWMIGAGAEFFTEMRRRLGTLPLIAEDLGVIDTPVNNLLKLSGLPGMKVWQFSSQDMEHMAPRDAARRVFYSGTHDNQTLVGWCADEYPRDDPLQKAEDILEKLSASDAPWVIAPLQDVLGLGDEARMNIPGTPDGNWGWKADSALLDDALAAKLRKRANKYGR